MDLENLKLKKSQKKIIVFNETEDILDYKLATCCNPISGDAIFGFITVTDGVKVHRFDCPNSIQLRSNYSYRILSGKWINKEDIDLWQQLTLEELIVLD